MGGRARKNRVQQAKQAQPAKAAEPAPKSDEAPPTAAPPSRAVLWLLAVAVLAGGGALAWWKLRPVAPESTELSLATLPPPPLSQSHYQNTGSGAAYIGSQACASCHQRNYHSYMLTAHSKALADLDPAIEPADGSYRHQLSGREYRVYRKDGQFRHEEVLKTPEGEVVAKMDLPIRYVVGSGHFTRSYLVEENGFLFESPITWYVSKKRWDMSPGYDFPGHASFERAITIGCLACHGGHSEQAPDSVRVLLHEKAIGCESCHGPGSLHAAKHKDKKEKEGAAATDVTTGGEDDLTIVHPGKLPRERLEAVCAFCHLNAAIAVPARGRHVTDFQPGLPLTDFRIDYKFDAGTEQMTVVGHIEQLRRSKCYQKSSELTCITCHDPHEKEKPKDSVAFYRQKCLDCHDKGAGGCKLDRAARLQREPADNCAACHMPRGDTDIPHVDFTHHRIGLHAPKRPAEPQAAVPSAQPGPGQPPYLSKPAPGAPLKRQPELAERVPHLVPTEDISYLPEPDQKRNLGLAYIWCSDLPQYAKYADTFRQRTRELLEPLHAAGLHDPLIPLALANAYWHGDNTRAAAYAQEAIDAKDLPPDFRAGALVIRASCYLDENKTEAAIPLLEEAVKLRRRTEDWRLLGRLYLEMGQPQKAVKALNEALAIRPYRYDIHGALGEAYRQLGDMAKFREHTAKAQWLKNSGQE